MPKKTPSKKPVTVSTDPKPTLKQAAAKKPAAKKTNTKKPASKKTPAPKAAAKKAVAKPVEKSTGKGRAHKAAGSAVFLPPDTYTAHIEGLMGQGLERGDAVDTLKVGIREANGLRVSKQLLATIQAASPQQAAAA